MQIRAVGCLAKQVSKDIELNHTQNVNTTFGVAKKPIQTSTTVEFCGGDIEVMDADRINELVKKT